MSHPLDRPIWSALASRQSAFQQGGAHARRFPADVSPFVAGADASPEALAAMTRLIPEGDDVSLLERAPPSPPEGVTETLRATCIQMTAQAFKAGGRDFALDPLGDDDAPEMLALALLTKPGPFRARTHKLGRFLGIRDQGRLVAMAGERLSAPGFHEISAVCTHPDYRGRGYGAALMRAVGERMIAEGDMPFLHTYASNSGAIALYRHLGFEPREEIIHCVWKRA